MKIYFCDVCNESIPLQDIKDGLATTINGKIYCREHNPLKAIKGLPLKKGPDKTLVSMFSIVIVLLVAVLALMVFGSGGRKNEYASLAVQNQIRRDLAEFRISVEKMRKDLDARLKTDKERDSKIAGMQTDIIQLRGDLGGFHGEVKQLSENLKAASDLRSGLQEFQLKLAEFNTRLSNLEGDFEGLRKKQKRFEQELSKLAKTRSPLAASTREKPAAGASSPSSAGAPGATGESPELKSLKEKLASKDNSVRFDAVNRVYDERIKEALPYVLPLIQDSDQFVQVSAIQTVGEFLYLPAVPALIRVLRDSDVTVREEALNQLVRMTGEKSLNFDPRGSSSEREKAVKKWEGWLKKNQ